MRLVQQCCITQRLYLKWGVWSLSDPGLDVWKLHHPSNQCRNSWLSLGYILLELKQTRYYEISHGNLKKSIQYEYMIVAYGQLHDPLVILIGQVSLFHAP